MIPFSFQPPIPPSGYRQAEDITDYLPDFLSQLPITLVLTVCISAFLLLGAMMWIGYFKPRRKKRLATQVETDTQNQAMSDAFSLLTDEQEEMPMPEKPLPKIPQNITPKKADEEELPDLGMLTTGLAKELPKVTPPPKKSSPAPIPTSTTAAPPPIASMGGMRQTIRLNTGDLIPADTLITIARDARDGRLVVQMNGVGYRTLVDDPKSKDQFVKLMRELSDVVNKPDDNPPTSAEATIAPPPPIEVAPPPVVNTPPPPPITTDGKMPGDLPKFKVDEAVKPTAKGKYEAVPLPELNIAEAIEAYLQHKLKYTPEYASRVIHVLSAPGGGVRIQVDNTFYEAVGDVADPSIRAFLQQTIAEWQARQ
ncbi:MAG: hypothetical protein KJ043_15220 [Anaerolineae bacterium]|nr:hypothetical protein [Anaerolineae bacterium]